jgi:hypothetical protein
MAMRYAGDEAPGFPHTVPYGLVRTVISQYSKGDRPTKVHSFRFGAARFSLSRPKELGAEPLRCRRTEARNAALGL